MNRNKEKVFAGLMALCMALSLAGCSPYIDNVQTDSMQTDNPDISQEDTGDELQRVSMETSPVISYMAKEQLPGVLVAQVGYSKTGDKWVIFRGSRLPQEYHIIDGESGETVYTGEIEIEPQGDSEEENEYQVSGVPEFVGYGDFTEFQTEGNYYIECDYLGRSYRFRIQEGLYTSLMEELVGTLEDRPILQAEQGKEVSEEEIIAQCRNICGLLLSVELFPNAQLNKVNGLENKTPDVLEYAAEQVAALTAFQDTKTGELGGASAWYCATLAKFSYSYQKYDSTFATKCLQAADKAWKYIDSDPTVVLEEERFFAATELYRATGKYRYHSVAKELGSKLLPDIENESLTYGGITYISTKWNLDRNICNTFIKDLMNQAEAISANSAVATYLSGALVTEEQSQTLFQQMVVMCVVDYIITNREYAFAIERHHLYLGGRNEEGNSFLNYSVCDTLSQTDLLSKPEYFGRYFLMLSEIKSHEQ